MIAWGAWLPAPAKVNLFLRVVGRRSDGYHLLQTVFRFVGLEDRLRFLPQRDEQIRLLRPLPGVPPEEDLVVRAARLLREATGRARGVAVEVDKRIPTGGGLGGGSSDAATTLIALNRLWDTRLERSQLAALGARLGADVPVFVRGRNAFGEGIGDQLTPIDLPARWYTVLVPAVAVPTRAIFADVQLTRNSERTTITAFFAGENLANDLEPVVRRRYPAVARALDWLNERAASRIGPARLSGSGSCVFAEFSTEQEARSVLAELPLGIEGHAVRGLSQHPLADP